METSTIEKKQKIPLIINLKREPKCLKEIGSLYIGRSKNNPNHFGNPFSHIKSSKGTVQVKSRKEAVSEFEKWLLGIDHNDLEQDRKYWILNSIWKVKQARKLACYCHPLPCHGDILKKVALKADHTKL